jgi:sterol desaturase/sphingolipid hydroxylase (fatty acid hydroxylase superfamily)
VKAAHGSESFGRLAVVLGIGAVTALVLAERRWPLRRNTQPPRRIARNIAMGLVSGAVLAAVEQPLSERIARRNKASQRGLMHRLPPPIGHAAAFLIMDYGFYLWHIATHKVPALWQLHRIHHLDRDLDASTALRFHFIDMLVSIPWQCLRVRLSGIDPVVLKAWRLFFFASILFHHSNWRLPGRWDARLSWFLTTPRMHGIHHSEIPSERNSNWSSGISWWDRAHGTLHADVPQKELVIGVGPT